MSTDCFAPGESDTTDRRILLVEDDRLSAKVAEALISALNCKVDTAPDAKTALKLLKTRAYQLILMDIGLPGMDDGIALTRRIRLAQWQNGHVATVPIVGLTAHVDQEDRRRCLEAGMNMVILKPLRKETVVELLAAFLENGPVTPPLSSTHPANCTTLDFNTIKASLKDDELVEECRELLMSGLSEDLLKLANWYKTSDWESIQAIAHKWQGGASYCGAKRLEQACKKFADYSRTVGTGDQMKVLYQQLVQEMEAVRTACSHHSR